MAEQVIISNGHITAEISAIGAEIKSIKKNGEEIMWQGDPSVWTGRAPLLFPICGGLRDDKFTFDGKEYILEKHGFARHREFETEKITDNSVTFLLKSDAETLKQYPFMFELRVTYTITDVAVEVRYDVTDTDSKTMYFSIGAHEAYACPNGIEEYSVIFDKPETLNARVLNGNLLEYKTVPIMENARELPLKKDYFAVDALVFSDINSRKVTLKNNRTNAHIDVSFEGFEYFLLWTKPNGNYICIEPWCGIQDFVDSDYELTHKKGIMAIKPGETDTRIHTIAL